MRLNLNDNIKVKLTEHGKDIYYHQYDRTNLLLGREVCKPSYPKVDEDGYTTFQLWCFIELYGIHMGMTLPNVIEPLDIVFDAPTIEPERKRGKWIWVSSTYDRTPCEMRYMCSECHHETILHSNEASYPWEKFCPNCGSDNREEGDHS